MPPKPDVRRLLKKQQSERNKTNKINHPFAKYDDSGRLVCVVCNAPVKSEAVWQAHLGSNVHRENIQKLRAIKQQQQQQLKRRAPSSPPTETFLDNHKRVRVEEEVVEEEDRQDIELDEQVSDEDEDMGLPNDFFDNPTEDVPEEVPEQVEDETDNTLPAGFFDDPEENARVQGMLAPEEQAQADLERDITSFNEAMIEVIKESRQVQEEDDETFWVERHYDISQEQVAFDSRVEKLKQLRQGQDSAMIVDQRQETLDDNDDNLRAGLKSSVRHVLKSKPAKKVESMFDDDDEDSDEDEEEDWRAQQL